jgi:bifunctional non-homologous end joining protein LigD
MLALRGRTEAGLTGPTAIPPIAAGAVNLRAKSFTVDGEAYGLRPRRVAVFVSRYRQHRATDAMLHAFDLLKLDDEDLRPLPLSGRKAKLARLPARASIGIAFSEHTDEDGAGGSYASGSGHLSTSSGGGSWHGVGSRGACSGTWVAGRR